MKSGPFCEGVSGQLVIYDLGLQAWLPIPEKIDVTHWLSVRCQRAGRQVFKIFEGSCSASTGNLISSRRKSFMMFSKRSSGGSVAGVPMESWAVRIWLDKFGIWKLQHILHHWCKHNEFWAVIVPSPAWKSNYKFSGWPVRPWTVNVVSRCSLRQRQTAKQNIDQGQLSSVQWSIQNVLPKKTVWVIAFIITKSLKLWLCHLCQLWPQCLAMTIEFIFTAMHCCKKRVCLVNYQVQPSLK